MPTRSPGRDVIPIKDVIPPRAVPVVTRSLIVAGLAVYVVQVALDADRSALLQYAAGALGLWVFADNVEDRMGRARFAAFYGTCLAIGLAASGVGQGRLPPFSLLAPGGVAGVLGAYSVLFRRSQVLAWVPLPPDLHEVPAILVVVLVAAFHLPLGPPVMLEFGVGFAAGAVLGPLLRRPLVW